MSMPQSDANMQAVLRETILKEIESGTEHIRLVDGSVIRDVNEIVQLMQRNEIAVRQVCKTCGNHLDFSAAPEQRVCWNCRGVQPKH